MLELGVGADLLRAVGWLLWAVLAMALLAALIKPKTAKGKALSVLLVLGIFFGPMLPDAYRAYEYKLRYAKAKALFDERCKTAGEKIYRTVENVEGVLLMKVRAESPNLSNQYALDDPFGADCHGQECIKDLLRVSKGAETNLKLTNQLSSGFDWVDVSQNDGVTTRYVGVIQKDQSHRLSLETLQASTPLPRYGITWDDISTKEDRNFWIAGGALKIIDLETKETIAERRGFMMDIGQGNTSGERSPWGFAYDNACPKFPTSSSGGAMRVGHTQKFVFSVLHSIKSK